MIRTLYLPLLFLASVLLETSLLKALPRPFSLIPIVFVIGVVLLHRVGVREGVVWFFLSGITALLFGFETPFFWHAFAVGGAGAFLAKNIFAHRSLYALLALGASLFFLERLLRVVSIELAHLFSHYEYLFTRVELSRTPRDLLILLVSLYLAYLVARYQEFLLRKIFYIR